MSFNLVKIVTVISVFSGFGVSAYAATYSTYKDALDGLHDELTGRNYAGAQAALEAAKALSKNAIDTLRVDIMQLGILGAQNEREPLGEELAARIASAKEAGITNRQCYDILNFAAGSLVRSRNYLCARKMMAVANTLSVPHEKKITICRYSDSAPLGVGGWFLSDYIENRENRESRFRDYDKKAADLLFTDIAADRSVEGSNSNRNYYLDNTGFYMVYDKAGWHVFVLCGEPETEDILAEGRGAGALEMFFSPGVQGESYYQWIIDLPGGKAKVYDWNSPHRYYRSLKPFLKSETTAFGKTIGTYVFLPWEAIYDKLPFSDDRWPFAVIRWSPAGGLTWAGKVHEVGGWGLVQWEKPSLEQATTIRRGILKKAWTKYKRSRDLQKARWSDSVIGDPAFFESYLRPIIDRFDAYEERIANIDALNASQIVDLYHNTVSEWMEFDYLVSGLRKEYLEIEFTTQ